MINIFRSNGHYLGFIFSQNIFLWDSNYLGWVDGQGFAWDKNGNFRGRLTMINGNNYIIKNKYQISPISKPVRPAPVIPVAPVPVPPVGAIALSIGQEDGF